MSHTTDSGDALLADFTAGVTRSGVTPATMALLGRLHMPLHPAGIWTDVVAGMVRNGFAAAAVEVADAAMRHFPHVGQLRYWRGNALRLIGRHDEAESDFRALLHQQPDYRDAALSLAFMLRENGRIDAAAQVIVALARARAGDASETLALLAFLRESGAYAQAFGIATTARQRWLQNAPLAAATGEIALALGKFDVARTALCDALTRDPEQAAAWLRLAHCQRYVDCNDADLHRFENASTGLALAEPTRICAGFALGKALDDLGDYAGAAQALRRANALAHATTPWRAHAWQQFVDAQIAGRTLPALADDVDFTAVFIIGLPRTGTTLAATVLGCHPQLRDRGELNWIGAMHANLQAQQLLHDPSALHAARTLVSAQLRRDDAPARGYIDKNPLNFRYLDLIAAIFPRAKIIHCRRGRRDTALSLWMQHFAHDDAGFAYDFTTIAEMAAGYERLMAHWRQTLPLPILDLDYESMAAGDPDCLRRLVEFLGVAPRPILQQPAAVSWPITTASVWQVRQPVHTHSIGRWRNYAQFLPELTTLISET